MLIMTFILSNNRKIIIISLLIFLSGFSLICWQEFKYNSQFSTAIYNGQNNCAVLGEIKEDLSSLQGDKIYLQPYYIGGKKVKYGLIQLDRRYLPSKLHNGELIKLKLTLYQPVKQKNPGGFSNYKYLKRKGIYSKGYYEGNLEFKGQLNKFFRQEIISLKYRLIRVIDQTADKPYNQLLKALLLGERNGLPEDWQQYFTTAGVNHLLAISGLHVGFILIIFLYLFNLIKTPPMLRNFILTLLIIIYIVMTGFRASVFRAGLLSLAFLWATSFNRQADLLNILGFTAFLNILINPYQLFSVGFQLSYFVLLMILLWYEILEKYLTSIFAVSASALLGSTPLTAYYFNMITPVAILSNIWAIPLAGLVISLALIGLLLGLINPLIAFLIFKLLILPIKLLIYGTHLMSLFPGGHLEIATPAVLILIIWLVLLVVLPFFLKRKVIPYHEIKRKKILSYLLIFSLLFSVYFICQPIFNKNFELTFISVGQGDSILLRSPGNRYLLVDGGGLVGSNSTQGELTLLPMFKHLGIKELTMVFITHFDADHAMGILDVLGNRKVDLLVLPVHYAKDKTARKIINKAVKYQVPVLLTEKGDSFQIDNVYLKVLNPDPAHQAISRNDNSIVIKALYHSFSALLTGDLEKEGERRLLKQQVPLNSDILKFGHHGSKTSSSLIFLKKVAPAQGIISVGKNNYGHPSERVLARARSLGIKVWRTDHQGAIKIVTNGVTYQINSFIK